MGTDKALIEVSGVPMAERVARVLEESGCQPVVFVGGDQRSLEELGRTFIPDSWPGEGPVGGVLSALDALQDATAVVVAPCDLPHLTAEVVGDLIGDTLSTKQVRVADSGRLEPVLACWPTAARGQLASAFGGGARSLRQVLDGFKVIRVRVGAAAVHNVNRPDDLPNRPAPFTG